MKVYVVSYPNHAGHWIYKGYEAAWKKLGYNVTTIPPEATVGQAMSTHMPVEGKMLEEEYIIMTIDALVNQKALESIRKSHKTFIFAQPNTFPLPWGSHPNFQCGCPDNIIQSLNEMDNVYLWTFGKVNPEFHHKWKKYILCHWHLILYLMFRLKKKNILNMIFVMLADGPIMVSMKSVKL